LTDQPVQQLIAEWQPPDPRDLGSAFFFIGVLIIIGAFAWAKTRPTPSEVLSVLAFLWLAFSGVRNVVWFGMVAMPVLARTVREWLPQKTAGTPTSANVLNLALAVLFFVPAVLLQPWWVNRLPLPEEYWSRVWRDSSAGPMLSVHTPVLGVEYLRQHPGGKLFNDMGYGSYLIWELPDQGVFVDPRVELYPYIQWLDYTRISNGINYNPLLNKYGANRLFLDVEAQSGLIDLLQGDSLWINEYADPYTQVWRRVGENKY
jgi:hypothetical protein